jgi:hypothetical protein
MLSVEIARNILDLSAGFLFERRNDFLRIISSYERQKLRR